METCGHFVCCCVTLCVTCFVPSWMSIIILKSDAVFVIQLSAGLVILLGGKSSTEQCGVGSDMYGV